MNTQQKQEIQTALQATQQRLLHDPKAVPSFLTLMSRLYKYSFSDQLAIFTQRPNALACGTYNDWKKVNRWVQSGTRGIALLDSKGGVRSVFDVSDTGSASTQPLSLWWQHTDQLQPALFDRLRQAPEFSSNSNSFEDLLQMRITSLTEQYMQSYFHSNQVSMDAKSFSDTLNASLRYMIGFRCGVKPSSPPSFSSINSVQDLYYFGTILSGLNQTILRSIEREAKQILQEQQLSKEEHEHGDHLHQNNNRGRGGRPS